MHCCLPILIALTLSSEPVPDAETWPDTPTLLSVEDQDRADYIINTMMATLGEIHSGSVQMEQDVTPRTEGYAQKNWLLFDYDHQLERFDQRSGRMAQRIRNEQEVIVHLPRVVSPLLGPPRVYPGYVSKDARVNESDIPGTMPLDIRTVGIGNLAHFRNDWTWPKFQERITNDGSLFPGTLSFLDESDPMFTDLVWVGSMSRKRPTKILLRLDRSRDYVPVLNVMYVQQKGRTFQQVGINSAEWEPRKKLWVPTRWRLTLEPAGIVHTLKFRWDSVNEPIDQRHFTLDDLDLPAGTSMINARIKDRVVVERVVGR